MSPILDLISSALKPHTEHAFGACGPDGNLCPDCQLDFALSLERERLRAAAHELAERSGNVVLATDMLALFEEVAP